MSARAQVEEHGCGKQSQDERSDSDALVIGGGLAGSAVAILLARAGRSVVLLEKTAAAHPKVCGEFLSHEALHYLGILGVDPLTLGAVPVDTVRLAGRGSAVVSARLPFPALSLSRERLDQALLEQASAAGVSVRRGVRVQSLVSDDRHPHWTATNADGEQYSAASAFLATGKHDLHGWNRPPGKQNDLVAFKMLWRLAPAQAAALERHVELITFPGGYAGLQPVEDGAANLCLLVRRRALRAAGGGWPTLLQSMLASSEHLRARLAGALPLWSRPLSLSAIPYGYVFDHGRDHGQHDRRRDRAKEPARSQPALWRLGDQSAVIPSFSGDGMSLALHSAALAAQFYLAGSDATAFQRTLRQAVESQVARATWLSRLLVHAPDVTLATARMLPAALPLVARQTRIPAPYLIG